MGEKDISVMEYKIQEVSKSVAIEANDEHVRTVMPHVQILTPDDGQAGP